jgi:hypothetical protein
MSLSRKIDALNKASADKHMQTLTKVHTTLSIMRQKRLPINFESVAKLAGVSKTWLYQTTLIRDEITKARQRGGIMHRLIDLQAVLTKKEKEITSLKSKNKLLQQKVEQLTQQLETVYGELYKVKQQTIAK